MELTPLGVLNYTSPTSTFQLGYVTIDPNNNVYSGSNYVQGDETEVLTSGTANLASPRTVYTFTGDYGGTTAPYNADGFYNGYMSVALPNGNVFIGSAPPTQTTDSAKEYTLGLTGSMNLTGLPSTSSSIALTSLFTPVLMGTAAGSVGTHGVVENASPSTAAPNSAGYVWWSNEVYSGSGLTVFAINRVNASGTPVSGFPITYASNNAVDRPEMPAIDQSGNLWITTNTNNTIVEWIGAGAPSYNPLSLASKNNALSTKP